VGRRWNFPRRLVSFEEQKEHLDGEKVGSLGKVVSPNETLRLKMMIVS